MQEQTAGKEHTTPKSKQNGKPKRKKSNLSGIMAFLVLFLAAYLILSLLTVAFIWYSFNSGAENDDIYSVRIYHDENLLHKISTTDANNEYGLYIPFEYLAEISSFVPSDTEMAVPADIFPTSSSKEPCVEPFPKPCAISPGP